jgi:hypothetical protein
VIRQHWKSIVIGFGAAILGGLVFLAGQHLWNDHADHHAMLQWAVQVQQAQARAAQAAPK